jgi:16S rRNA (guanine527-N7)-methyltransferase
VGPLTAADVAARLAARRIAVSLEQAETLASYLGLLERWNRVHNLTGVLAPADLVDRHLAESLALERHIKGRTVADVGSGGGLPGVPLAIRLPSVAFTLIEARRKRASFLRHAVATLELDNATVAHSRAEDLTSGPFATVTARAVAPPAELLAMTSGLVSAGGRLLLLTSEDRRREIGALAAGFIELSCDRPFEGSMSRIVVLERAAVP